jgi:5-formyltetrahydrofolate cyclo-ligase
VSVQTENQTIRQKIIERRKSLLVEEAARLSQQVCLRFLERANLQEFDLKNLKVGLYRAFQAELDLSVLEGVLRENGCQIYYPRISLQDRQQMEFVEIPASADSQLSWKISPYGFKEPHPELPAIDPRQINLIFTPGVAFGEAGERLGRGAGHYDRYLSQVSSALRIALAYDFQVFPKLDQNEWDQPVHWVLTEKRDYEMSFLRDWLKNRGNA